jgi:hypothetical protein
MLIFISIISFHSASNQNFQKSHAPRVFLIRTNISRLADLCRREYLLNCRATRRSFVFARLVKEVITFNNRMPPEPWQELPVLPRKIPIKAATISYIRFTFTKI